MAKTSEKKEKVKPLFSRKLDIGTLNFDDKTEEGSNPKLSIMFGKKKPVATIELSDDRFADISIWDGKEKEPCYTVKLDLSKNSHYDKRIQSKEEIEDEFLSYFLKETPYGTFKLFFVRLGAPGDVGVEAFVSLGEIMLVDLRRYFDKQNHTYNCFKVGVRDVEGENKLQNPIYETVWEMK